MGGKRALTLFIAILVLLAVLTLLALALAETPAPFTFLGGQENISPSDWVQESQIKVYPQMVVLDLPAAKWAKFTDTNSMDPFIDETANAIELTPVNPGAINVGDVISYETAQGVLVHRVIGKGRDGEGYYYIVKGDNNRWQDPFKVRFGQVQGVVVAVIY